MADRQPQLRRGQGPFSRLLDIKDVRDDTLTLSIEATADERNAVAAEIDLPALDLLQATFTIRCRAGGRFEVEGALMAEVTERCVVTLEPFPMSLDQEIEVAFAPARLEDVVPERGARGDRKKRAAPPVPAVGVAGTDDQEDPPDPIVDDRIDLGAVAVEFLNLARDPYPKKPGVHFKDVVSEENDAAEPSALAVALERFKDRP